METLIDRAQETIKKQRREIRQLEGTINSLQKIIAKLQTAVEKEKVARGAWYNKYVEYQTLNKQLHKVLDETKRKRDFYLRAYQESKLASDPTDKDCKVTV